MNRSDGDTESPGQQLAREIRRVNWTGRGEQACAVEVRAPVFEWAAGGPGNAQAGGVSALLPAAQPFIGPPLQRRLFVRDLAAVIPTAFQVVPYARELSPLATEGGASAVAEGGARPDASGSVGFTPASAPMTTVAANLTVSDSLLEDAPAFVAYIDGRLGYLVAVREEAEVLSGSGTWPDMTGIRNTAGIQTQASAGSVTASVAAGAGKVGAAGGVPSGLVIHPADLWASYSANPVFWDSDSLPAGLRVVVSASIPQGQAVVGDWTAASLFVRESFNLAVFPQHADFRVRNEILVVGEERVGLAVTSPALFCAVTL